MAIEVGDHRLDLLMTYTTFHIGLYMSLIAAIIAARAVKPETFPALAELSAIACFLVAGACGAIIAVNVAEFDVNAHAISEFFNGYHLSVAGIDSIFLYSWLEHTEHSFFWIGIVALTVGYFRARLK